MESFLKLLAKDLKAKYTDLSHITVVFPNKRAGLFLARELAAISDKHIWMPEILTINNFMERQTGWKLADELILTIKLYKAYQEVTGSSETFDRFYFWGSMMLGDFNDVDKYMIDARMIFTNLSALQKLEEEFPWLSEEQAEIIRSFWSNFRLMKDSDEKSEFMKVWDALYPTYMRFRELLAADGLCYEGMGLRRLAENMSQTKQPRQILFAGFNALNNSLRSIFSYYQSNGTGAFYWDYDVYYLANEHHEAGRFMRENLKLFPNALGKEHFNNFCRNGKKIEFISVSSSVGQAKLIPDLLSAIPKEEYHDTVIVLCDEQLMIPVVHSLPDSVSDINITMGYPAQNTSVSSLIYLLGELRKYAREHNGLLYYYYKPIIALLNHKLVKATDPDIIDKFVDRITRENRSYLSANDLALNELCKNLFASAKEDAPHHIMHIMSILLRTVTNIHPTEREFIFSLYLRLRTLVNTFKEQNVTPEDRVYMQIITKILSAATIPFSGEPLKGLQLMGILETRLLDFKNLIILSANEGIIPRAAKASSFIPYTLRTGFRLPTPEFEDALYAYNFNRLLQRGQNIRILYTSPVSGVKGGEMSRFLLQMEYETDLDIKRSSLQNTVSLQDSVSITIPQTEETLQRFRYLLTEHRLSPSAFNLLLLCPLRFYYKYIASFKEPDEITDSIDARILGNIVHHSMQLLYENFDGQITATDIENLLTAKELIEQTVKQVLNEEYPSASYPVGASAVNDFALNVVRRYIRRILEYDKTIAPFRILETEKDHTFTLSVNADDVVWKVQIGGIIDRVDQTEFGIRIIDYKTGGDKADFVDVSTLFGEDDKKHNKAALQIMLYCLAYTADTKTPVVVLPGIYNVRQMFHHDFDFHLYSTGLKSAITDIDNIRPDLMNQLEQYLATILSPSYQFTQTPNVDNCKNCPYARICRR